MKQIENELERLRAQIESPKSPYLSYAPSGQGREDVLAKKIAKLVDLERLHTDRWDKVYAKRIEIEKAIDALEDSEQRRLMRYKYVDGLYWEEICVKLHVSYRTVHRIHSEALKNSL
jgi:DNA-directed RNA polymerase specialized sigma24 family protein